MKTSTEGRSVFSDIFADLSVVNVLSIPNYLLEQDWLQLTIAIGLCILTIRFAITLRKKDYYEPE
jgi:hypothetical protein